VLVFIGTGLVKLLITMSQTTIVIATGANNLAMNAIIQGAVGMSFFILLIVWARFKLLQHFSAATAGTLGKWRRPFRSKRQSMPPPLPAKG